MGSCPDWAKEVFVTWVESWGYESKERYFYPYNELVMGVGDPPRDVALTHLLGKLWRCTDLMPADLCDRLDLEHGSSYARAAQWILAMGRRGKFWIPRAGFRIPPS